jgi:hypothetical protein
MKHVSVSLTLCTARIKRVGCKNLIYGVTDVWLEVNLQQDLTTLSDRCRGVVEVEFHMFSISFEFHHFLASCILLHPSYLLRLYGAVLDIVVVSRMSK